VTTSTTLKGLLFTPGRISAIEMCCMRIEFHLATN
jgi:hypothetical protein